MLRGSLTEFPLPNVLQMLTTTGVNGKLNVEHVRGGELWLSGGEVVHAQALGHEGAAALDLLASVESGNFTFVSNVTVTRRTVQLPINALLRQLAVEGDSWRELLQTFPDWARPLRFTSRWSEQQLVTRGQYRLLSTVGQMPLSQMVARSELPPRATLETLRLFIQAGLIE